MGVLSPYQPAVRSKTLTEILNSAHFMEWNKDDLHFTMKIQHENIGKHTVVFGKKSNRSSSNETCTNTKPNTITCHSDILKFNSMNHWWKFVKNPMLTFKDKKTTCEFFKVIHIACIYMSSPGTRPNPQYVELLYFIFLNVYSRMDM